MVPDRQLIMENMLMAEGFVEAKMLAKKFASLYYLLEDLLSPQKHYDWGLRAIKSVLVVAGSLLRAEAGQVEADVLFRALRDFNIPKILAEDMVIFMGLLNDLFPGALCAVGMLASTAPVHTLRLGTSRAKHSSCVQGLPVVLPLHLHPGRFTHQASTRPASATWSSRR